MRRRRIYRIAYPFRVLRSLGVRSITLARTGQLVLKVGAKARERTLSVEEVIDLLGVARATVYEAMQAGLLAYEDEEHGRSRHISAEALRAFILANAGGEVVKPR